MCTQRSRRPDTTALGPVKGQGRFPGPKRKRIPADPPVGSGTERWPAGGVRSSGGREVPTELCRLHCSVRVHVMGPVRGLW